MLIITLALPGIVFSSLTIKSSHWFQVLPAFCRTQSPFLERHCSTETIESSEIRKITVEKS